MSLNQEHKSAHKEQGFTLVEILIAITIFAIGILGIASMQAWGLRGNASAVRHTQAATFAADRIEKLMMVDYADLANGSETQGDYTISWTVSLDNPINNTATITVNVQWNDHGTVKNFTPPFTSYHADL